MKKVGNKSGAILCALIAFGTQGLINLIGIEEIKAKLVIFVSTAVCVSLVYWLLKNRTKGLASTLNIMSIISLIVASISSNSFYIAIEFYPQFADKHLVFIITGLILAIVGFICFLISFIKFAKFVESETKKKG